MNLTPLNPYHMRDELIAAGTERKQSEPYRFARSLRASSFVDCGLPQVLDLMRVEPQERNESDFYQITASIGSAVHNYIQDRLQWRNMAFLVLNNDSNKAERNSKRNPRYLVSILEQASLTHLLPVAIWDMNLQEAIEQSFKHGKHLELQEELVRIAFSKAYELDPEEESVVDELEDVLLKAKILQPSIEQWIEDATDEAGAKDLKNRMITGIMDAVTKRRNFKGKRSLFLPPFPTEIKTMEGSYWNYKVRSKEYEPTEKYRKKIAHFEAQLQLYLHYYRTPLIYGARQQVEEGMLYIVDRSNPVEHQELWLVKRDPVFMNSQLERLERLVDNFRNGVLPDPEPHLGSCRFCVRRAECPATEEEKSGQYYRFTKPR